MIYFNIVEMSQFALMLSLPPGIAVESDMSYKQCNSKIKKHWKMCKLLYLFPKIDPNFVKTNIQVVYIESIGVLGM